MAEGVSDSVPAARVLVLWSDRAGRHTAERLLRTGAAGWSDVPEADVRLLRLCPACGSDRHGRPLLAPVRGRTLPFVSISRAGPVTVVALCDAGAVGVDVEPAAAAGFPGFDAVALHPRETAPGPHDRTLTWVRKESLLKATGQGLDVDPAWVRLTAPSEPPALVSWAGPDPPRQPVWMHDLDTVAGHVAAVSVLAAAAPALEVRQEPPAAPADPSGTATGRTAR